VAVSFLSGKSEPWVASKAASSAATATCITERLKAFSKLPCVPGRGVRFGMAEHGLNDSDVPGGLVSPGATNSARSFFRRRL